MKATRMSHGAKDANNYFINSMSLLQKKICSVFYILGGPNSSPPTRESNQNQVLMGITRVRSACPGRPGYKLGTV